MKLHILITAVALAAGGIAFAQTAPAAAPAKDPIATPKLDARQANQQGRIDQGVASGQLTPRETANLEKREARLEADKQAARSDGRVTSAERRRLQREANRASRRIAAQKHDKQVVTPAR